MSMVTEEGGRLNNYATEPKMYLAEAPEPTQKRRYLFLGGLAFLFVSSLVATALAVS